MNYAFRHGTCKVASHLNIKSSIFPGMEYLIGGDATTYHMHTERDDNLGKEEVSFAVTYLRRILVREINISESSESSVLNTIDRSCIYNKYFSHFKLHQVHSISIYYYTSFKINIQKNFHSALCIT
jgi:hypothetical protein